MLRQRFSFISVVAMMGMTVFAVLEVLRMRGMVGFTAHQGIPFRWYWYTDISTQYDPGYSFSWSGLALDVAIWSIAVLVVGLVVEFIVQRFPRKRDSKNVT